MHQFIEEFATNAETWVLLLVMVISIAVLGASADVLVDNAVKMIVESLTNVNAMLRIDNFIMGGSVGLNSYFYKKIKDQLKEMQSPLMLKRAKLQSKAELYGCYAYIDKRLFLKK